MDNQNNQVAQTNPDPVFPKHNNVLILMIVIAIIFLISSGCYNLLNQQNSHYKNQRTYYPSPKQQVSTSAISAPISSSVIPTQSMLFDLPSNYLTTGWVKLSSRPSADLTANDLFYEQGEFPIRAEGGRTTHNSSVSGVVTITDGDTWQLTQTGMIGGGTGGLSTNPPSSAIYPLLQAGWKEEVDFHGFTLQSGGASGTCGSSEGFIKTDSNLLRIALLTTNIDVCGMPMALTPKPGHQVTTLFLSKLLSSDQVLSLINQDIQKKHLTK